MARRPVLSDLAAAPAAEAVVDLPADQPITPAATTVRTDDRFTRTTVLIPTPAYALLRAIAFEEHCHISDLVMEGLDVALRRRGKIVNELKRKRRR